MFKILNSIFSRSKNRSRLKLSKPKSSFLKHKLEAAGILLGAFFVILFLSLISYYPKDKSWFFFTTANNEIQNWCGFVGANFSALLFFLFGQASYLFVLAFAFLAYLLFAEKNHVISRFVAFLFLTLSFSAILFGYNLNFATNNGQILSGGLFGYYFFNLFAYPFGILGSKILNFSIMLSSLIIASKTSIIEMISGALKLAYNFLYKSYLKIKNFCLILAKQVYYGINIIYSKLLNIFKSRKQGTNKKQDKLFAARNQKDIVWPDEYKNSNFINFKENKHKHEFKSFSNKSIFLKSRTYVMGRFDFLLIPNTIFRKNIFFDEFLEKYYKFLKLEKNRKKFTAKIDYELPDTKIFERENELDEKIKKELEEESKIKGRLLEEKLGYFGIKGKVTAIRPGPVITLFEYRPEIDSKISKIMALEDDLALALTALSIRIVAPIPGRSVVGFEISNKSRQKVFLSNLLESKEFKKTNNKLPVVFGVDIVGRPVIQDLSSMPHLLVAGSTGSGKSVGLNTMLVSLLCNFSPDQLKLILIDPKRLEFAPYKDIPHLLFPIITNPRKACPVLKWLVQEMERRYDQMAQAGVRNISEYRELLETEPELEQMPYIVLMIDELADLMMVAGKDIELHIARIAQMARAAGIHMIVATQRPSVDVVTGLIKVNFPSRVAFRVSSKIDSRTIIDSSGAEKLLGKGDLLYMNSASSDLQRIHGSYVGVKEVEKLTAHLRTQAKPEYLDLNETLKEMDKNEVEQIKDDLYPEVIDFLKTVDELSISGLQRKYRIGFNRSARLIEKLELDGFLAPAQGSKPRKVLKENL